MDSPDDLLTTAEVAQIMRSPVSTLRYWRHLGTGPHSFRLGRRVVYRRADVTAWLLEQAQAGRAERAGVDQPWSASIQASAKVAIRVAEVIAPTPPGAWRLVSSAFSARSAAARDASTLETSRTRPSLSRNFTRARTRPLGSVAKRTLPLVPSGSGGRPKGHTSGTE
jgi:predicted DNA-binding transcriptional regulator AlpA